MEGHSESKGYTVERHEGGGHQWSPEGNRDIAEALVGSITSTLRNQNGGRLYGDVTDDSRVTIENVEMSVAQARARGLVDIQDGRLIEGPRDSQGTRQEQPDAEGEPDGFLEVDAELADTFDNWSGAIKAFTGSDQAVVSTLSQFLNEPGKLPDLLVTMAERQGRDPGEFQQQAVALGAAYEDAIDRKVMELGVLEPSEFWDHVRQRLPAPELNRVFLEMITAGNDQPLRELVDQYQRFAPLGSDDTETEVSVTVDGRRVNTTTGNARRNGWL